LSIVQNERKYPKIAITKYRKQGILPLVLDVRKLKGFQLQGGFAPLTP